jgi:type I restriction enzyme, S subunit
MIELLKIEDFANVITGGTPSTLKNEYWQDGDIPWLNSGELNQDIITFSNNFITAEGLRHSAARLMPPETVLIALTGATTGKIGYLTFEACANQSVTGILPSKRHFPKFLYYYLNSIRNRVLNDAYGGAQSHISQGYVKNLKIPLPPLETQKKIATILDKADDLRQNDRKILEKYDQLAKSVFLEMFGDPIKNTRGLKIARLVDITTKITDGVHAKPNYVEEGVPFISVKDITTGVLEFDKCKFISKEDHQNFTKRCRPEYEDILYTKVGATYGRPALVDKNIDFSIYVSVALIKPKREIINSYFLKEALAHPAIKRQADKAIKGIGVPDLHLNMIKEFVLPLPSLAEQEKYAAIMSKVEFQKKITQESIRKSEDLFQSLLQSAFKGEQV